MTEVSVSFSVSCIEKYENYHKVKDLRFQCFQLRFILGPQTEINYFNRLILSYNEILTKIQSIEVSK